ncbi:hypothetical protein Nepgr_014276 [Nepenthes gracilis]|uniref:FLZ-type domain-containing protein n=1 Tax=Nepenthes gracilis TaxID=150966 RepID=A0AAD3XQA3_NEPGR|nr:hypothetical protein Nepgr_014276 [Nepenthes gracilis]
MGQITSDGGSESYLHPDFLGQKQKTNSFFNVPGLFVGLTSKGMPDCDSVRSPTSPLDFKLLSNLGNSFRFPKSSHDGHHKSWDCHKVGLSILDSIDDADNKLSGDVLGSSGSKNILFGPQIKTKTPNSPFHFNISESPKSLPKSCAIFPQTQIKCSNLQKGSSAVMFEIGKDPWVLDTFPKTLSLSLDSKRLGSWIYNITDHKTITENSCFENLSVQVNLPPKSDGGSDNLENFSQNKLGPTPVLIGSGSGFVESLSPSEIELSEDYTRVISRGSNPKTIHIFGDYILECHTNETDSRNNRGDVEIGLPKLGQCSSFSTSNPSDNFLSFCYFCKKKLDEGKDIYMYRGEKAFCSLDCRLEEISIEERKEKSNRESTSESKNGEDFFENGMFVAIEEL